MRKTCFVIAVGFTLLASTQAQAHCQIPCGIYDDEARIESMREDITTIRKAVGKIHELTGTGDAQSLNQAVPWINNKEIHASNIIETVSLYFLTQKLKPPKTDDEAAHHAYHEKLIDHHAVMCAAMKTKQTVSVEAVTALTEAVERMARHYGHAHSQSQPHTRGH